MEEYEIYNHIQIANIKNNSTMLKKFIIQARKEADVKIVELAQVLGISKNFVGNIITNTTKSHKILWKFHILIVLQNALTTK